MNTADLIADAARDSAAANFDGSAIIRRDGTRFIPGDVGARCIASHRNRAGRVEMSRWAYADGSELLFTWSEHNGARFVARRPKATDKRQDSADER